MSATEPKAEDPIFKEPILGQFLGDEKFPVTWTQELEKHLFWVYDDLHNPHPLSPMHETSVSGRSRVTTCSGVSGRRSPPTGSPRTSTAISTRRRSGQLGIQDRRHGAGAARHGGAPRPDYAAKIGTYLGAVLPTYGEEFADWWYGRLVPR